MGSKTCVIRNSADSSLPGGRQLMILNSSSVIKILNFKPTRAGTFHFYSAAGANIAATRVSKIRGRRDDLFTRFVTRSFTVTYRQGHLRRETTERRRAGRKVLTRLPRGPRGVATGPPLQDNKAVVASPGGPYGRKTVAFQDKISKQKVAVFFALKKPSGPPRGATEQKRLDFCMCRPRKSTQNGV